MRTLLAACALTAALLAAGTAHAAYRVVDLPAPGRSASAANSINDRGWVAGHSTLRDGTMHATLWRRGSFFDLGTLGGPNSSVEWPVKNVRGIVVGISQTAEPDPYGERWSCAAFFPEATATGYRCVGFKWEDGVMTELPTLGGTHGFAAGANNWGQVAGWAENKVRDPSCVGRQIFQFRAVLWGPRARQVRELPPFPGDSVSAATALNDRGQVVGISGRCDQAVGRFSAIHAVLWEKGRVTEIEHLGGVAWHTPMAINQRGDVVGFSNFDPADGGGFRPHGFLWRRHEGTRPLRPLPGDDTSQAVGINERGQVVGTSCDADDNCRAVLWHRGVAIDLNTLVAPGYAGRLTSAGDIDNRGRITGRADYPGASTAFVATPWR